MLTARQRSTSRRLHLSAKMGWSKRKASNFVHYHSDEFEQCKRGAAAW